MNELVECLGYRGLEIQDLLDTVAGSLQSFAEGDASRADLDRAMRDAISKLGGAQLLLSRAFDWLADEPSEASR